MNFINKIISGISNKNASGERVEVTTDKDYWLHNGREASKLFGAAGAIYEIIQNLIEAFFNKIRVLCCQDDSLFSILVLGYGENGVQLKDEEYCSKLMKLRVDSKKTIGIHAGEGEKKACSGQIYDKEDGLYVRGTINFTDSGEEEIHMIMWDGKGNECVRGEVLIMKPEDCIFYNEIKGSRVFAGLTRSNFRLESVDDEKNDCELLEEYVKMNISPALESGKVEISVKFGDKEEYNLEPYDIKLNKVFETFPEIKNDKHTYFEREYVDFPELNKYGVKVYGVKVKDLDDNPETRDKLIEILPECYLGKRSDGKTVLMDKILMMDDYYVYYSGKIDALFRDSKSYKGYDAYMLIVIEADTEFFRNFGYDSCKIRGLRDPFSEDCTKSLSKSIRSYITANLRQGYQTTVSSNIREQIIKKPDIKIDTTPEYGLMSITRVLKKSEDEGNNVELVCSIPKVVSDEFGFDPRMWEKVIPLIVDLYVDCEERYLKKIGNRKPKWAKDIAEFLKNFLVEDISK